MAKKKGERYKCDQCGLILLVEDECGCEDCDVFCCGVPMKPLKAEKKTVTAKAKAKATKVKK